MNTRYRFHSLIFVYYTLRRIFSFFFLSSYLLRRALKLTYGFFPASILRGDAYLIVFLLSNKVYESRVIEQN